MKLVIALLIISTILFMVNIYFDIKVTKLRNKYIEVVEEQNKVLWKILRAFLENDGGKDND